MRSASVLHPQPSLAGTESGGRTPWSHWYRLGGTWTGLRVAFALQDERGTWAECLQCHVLQHGSYSRHPSNDPWSRDDCPHFPG